MKQKNNIKSNELAASAAVVDGKLILTLPEAVTPVVWQMDLDQAKSSALEVIEDKKKGTFSLMLRNTKGETIEVAPFEQKSQAVEALMLTSQALQDGQGKIRAAPNVAQVPYQAQQGAPVYQPTPTTDSSNKIGGILAIVLIIVLMLVWVISIPRQGDFNNISATASGDGHAGAAPSSGVATGVPVSADEFLGNQ